MKHNILLTICARGGSKGVKGKNIRLLCGKPLIAYTIEQAKKWGKADHIIVSTDSIDIAEISKKYGAEVPFLRPPELATDTAKKLDAMRHALGECEKIFGKHYDSVVDLDPTSPVRTVDDIQKAYQKFLVSQSKTLFSVIPAYKNPYFNMVEIDSKEHVHLCKVPNTPIIRRQDAPRVYDMNASIYIYKCSYIKKKQNVSAISNKTALYIMDETSGIDIDREIDFNFIEFLIQKKKISL